MLNRGVISGGVRGIGGLSGDIGGVRWDRGVGWGRGVRWDRGVGWGRGCQVG